jgi:hypothetical protein
MISQVLDQHLKGDSCNTAAPAVGPEALVKVQNLVFLFHILCSSAPATSALCFNLQSLAVRHPYLPHLYITKHIRPCPLPFITMFPAIVLLLLLQLLPLLLLQTEELCLQQQSPQLHWRQPPLLYYLLHLLHLLSHPTLLWSPAALH